MIGHSLRSSMLIQAHRWLLRFRLPFLFQVLRRTPVVGESFLRQPPFHRFALLRLEDRMVPAARPDLLWHPATFTDCLRFGTSTCAYLAGSTSRNRQLSRF